MRPLAFIDLETTGLDPARHEILEIGVIRVHGDTLKEVEHAEVRVRPGRIADADPDALRVNGYSPGAWKDAVALEEALARVAPLLDDALLAGHNVWFDRAFLDAAWRQTGLTPPEMDHHVLDTATLVWPLCAVGLVDALSLLPVCERLGIDTNEPHHTLADARRSLELARCLLPEASLLTRARDLEADERALVETIVARVDAGRRDYGPWRTDDGRDYPGEALAEVLDALNYCAAELVRMHRASKAAGMRTRRVYVCHPFADDPEANAERVRGICRALSESGFLPIAPHVYLPQLWPPSECHPSDSPPDGGSRPVSSLRSEAVVIDEDSDRERALGLCLDLVDTCDELRVYGGRVTAGMRREIEHAERRGIPVRFAEEVA